MDSIEIIEELKEHNNLNVKCLCFCGTEFIARKANIVGGYTKSCGCLRKIAHRELARNRQKVKLEDYIGKTINNLTIISEEYVTVKSGAVHRYFVCKCSCGNDYKGDVHMITQGRTKSCGCWKKIADKRPKSHGMSKDRPYIVWCGIIARTTNANEPSYKDYIGRGISVCDKWKTFEGFWEDMQEGYSDSLTLDRIDVDGNYCKENCRWTTMSVQGHNKRKKAGTESKYIGVTLDSKTLKWRARIAVTKTHRKHLGMFETEYSAAFAYDNASEEIYGDRPNKT